MSPRTLFLDVESAPTVVHAWSLRDLHVGLNQIVADPYLIGVGVMWDGDRSPRYLSTWDEGGRKAMLETLWDLLDEADVVCHYNGDSFDTPWINGEFMREGMTPPSPSKSIDLYKVFKKNARFVSHKLDYVAGAILGEHKLPTGGHSLWVSCMEGDEKARKRMALYCKRDVALLPRLLEKARPWLGAQINFALYAGVEDLACQKCGSDDLEKRGFAYSPTGIFQQYRCRDCGGWTRDTKRVAGIQSTGVAR